MPSENLATLFRRFIQVGRLCVRCQHLAFVDSFIDTDAESFGVQCLCFQIREHPVDNGLPSAQCGPPRYTVVSLADAFFELGASDGAALLY